jgi:hypothetical protein
LNRPTLCEAAEQFRTSAAAWQALAPLLLPGGAPLLAETRRLMDREHTLFLQQGNGSLSERKQIHGRLHSLKQQAETDFPLNEPQVTNLLGTIGAQVLKIHDLEQTAVTTLQHAMN